MYWECIGSHAAQLVSKEQGTTVQRKRAAGNSTEEQHREKGRGEKAGSLDPRGNEGNRQKSRWVLSDRQPVRRMRRLRV